MQQDVQHCSQKHKGFLCSKTQAAARPAKKPTTETSLKNSIRGVDLARLFSTGLLAAITQFAESIWPGCSALDCWLLWFLNRPCSTAHDMAMSAGCAALPSMLGLGRQGPKPIARLAAL